MTAQCCPVCGAVSSVHVKKWRADKDYTLSQCGQCSLQYWWPGDPPDPSYYATVSKYTTHLPQLEVSAWSEVRKALEGLSGRGLDVGCGSGVLMRRLQELGFEVHGLDFDADAIAMARKSGLQNLYVGSLDEFVTICPPQSFDLVTFFDVLEHQNQPKTFLRQI